MHSVNIRYLVLCLLCTLSCTNGFSQLEKYNIDYPYKGDIAKMHFDTTGYIWFHDDKDFYKYNGHQIDQVGLNQLIGKKNDDYFLYGKIIFVEDSILFLNDNKVSLIHPESKTIKDVWQLPGRNYFKYLYQDEEDNIWVFASTWDNKRQPVYKSVDGKHFEEVFDLNDHVDEKGVFWTYYELDDKDGHLYFLWRMGDMLILDHDGNEIELDVLDEKSYLSTKSCAQFRLDNKKQLWRIYNTDFEIYNETTKSFQKHELSGKIEFTTDCKIEDEKQEKRIGLPETGSMLSLKYIFTDHENRIWMACAASYLVCFDPLIDDIINFRQPLVDALGGGDSDIEKLFQDDSYNLWGFKRGGIFKIRETESYFDSYLVNTKSKSHLLHSNGDNPTYKRIHEYYDDYAIRNSAIHSISEDQYGNLIFQEGVFTFRLDPNTQSLELLPVFAPKESVHITYDEHLKVFGVWDSYYSLNEDFVAKKMSTPMLKLEYTFVQSNGDIWVSGLLSMKSYLFAKLDKKTLNFNNNYLDPTGGINFSINKVISMDEDEDGMLWLATLEGLIQFDVDNNTFNHYGDTFKGVSDSIKIATVVNQIKHIDKGLMWFSTNFEIGLLDTKSKTLINYMPIDPNTIGQQAKIISFGDSVVWIGHNTGLTYHNFNSKETVSVSGEEGIVTNGAVHVMTKLSDGQIAVGTNNGLYTFHPDSLLYKYSLQKEFQEKIPLKLNKYSIIKGSSDSLLEYEFIQDTDMEISLDYNDKMLELEYAILNFNFPDRHLFSYQLDGYDSQWSTPSNANKAKYTSLPAGKYTFKAMATSGSGVWSRNLLSIPITVKQAWYYSWWFIFSVISAFTLISYLVTRYYYREKLAKRLAIEKLRTKISNDLHDDVGSILSGLAIQSELMSMSYQDENKVELLDISKQSRSAMEKMRDIVWAMNSERDKFENLIDRMRDFAASQFKHSDLKYEINLLNIKGQTDINPDIRQNLYFIFKEAITNAIKHSNGDMVKINLFKLIGQVILSIKDNGTNFSAESSEGLGLSSIQTRAKMINAKVYFNTESGYEVRVVI